MKKKVLALITVVLMLTALMPSAVFATFASDRIKFATLTFDSAFDKNAGSIGSSSNDQFARFQGAGTDADFEQVGGMFGKATDDYSLKVTRLTSSMTDAKLQSKAGFQNSQGGAEADDYLNITWLWAFGDMNVDRYVQAYFYKTSPMAEAQVANFSYNGSSAVDNILCISPNGRVSFFGKVLDKPYYFNTDTWYDFTIRIKVGVNSADATEGNPARKAVAKLYIDGIEIGEKEINSASDTSETITNPRGVYRLDFPSKAVSYDGVESLPETTYIDQVIASGVKNGYAGDDFFKIIRDYTITSKTDNFITDGINIALKNPMTAAQFNADLNYTKGDTKGISNAWVVSDRTIAANGRLPASALADSETVTPGCLICVRTLSGSTWHFWFRKIVASVQNIDREIRISATAAEDADVPVGCRVFVTPLVSGFEDLLSEFQVKFFLNDSEIVGATADGFYITVAEGENTLVGVIYDAGDNEVLRSSEYTFYGKGFLTKKTYSSFDFETSRPSISENSGTVEYETIDQEQGLSLKMTTGPTGGPSFATKNIKDSNENLVAFEAWYRFDDFNYPNRGLMFLKFNSNGAWFNPFTLKSNGDLVLNRMNSQGQKSEYKTLMTCNNTDWYKFKVIYDITSDMVSVFINDVFYASERLIGIGINTIQYMTIDAFRMSEGSSVMHLDNVSCYSLKEKGSFFTETIEEAEYLNGGSVITVETAGGGKALSLSSEASFNVNASASGEYSLYTLCRGNGAFTVGGSMEEVDSSEFTWHRTMLPLTKGMCNVTLSPNTGDVDIDRFVLVTPGVVQDLAPKAYVARDMADEYPLLIDNDYISSVAPFVPGDRVAFIGDSITHQSYYPAELMNYFATRYPDTSFSYMNRGINGSWVSGAIKRLEWDIYSSGFNKVVICLGMNDLVHNLYLADSEYESGTDSQRESYINSYRKQIPKLVNKLREDSSIDQIILAGPTIFDEWQQNENGNSPGFNNVLRQAAAWLADYADEQGLDFIDLNTPQLTAKLYNVEKDSSFLFASDRVHPNRTGNIVMAYTFLKEQGQSGTVAEVSLDASGELIESDNADVSNITASNNEIHYVYSPHALPLAADASYREAEAIVPLTDEYNREMIRVTGLADGNYKILLDSNEAIVVTAEQLAAGVNIADLENNPSQQRSLAMKAYIDEKRDIEYAIRSLAQEQERIFNANLSSLDPYDTIGSAQSIIQSGSAGAGAQALETYILNQFIAQSKQDLADAYEAKIYTVNKPGAYNVSIVPTNDEATQASTYQLVHYELPQNVINIRQSRPNETVIVGNAVFENDCVSAIIENRYAGRDVKVTLFAATYDGSVMTSIDKDSYTLKPGEQKTFQAQIDDLYSQDRRVFIWNGNSISPLTTVAHSGTDSLALKEIRVAGKVIEDFSNEKSTYTIYLDSMEYTAPFVTAIGENNASVITVTQCTRLPGNAEIKISNASGEERTITVEFVKTPLPKLTDIKIDGASLADFSSDIYTYTAKRGNVTATAAQGLSVNVNQNDSGATISVIPPKGILRVYKINFN